MMGVKEKFNEELHGLQEYVALATVEAKSYQKTNIEIIKYFTEEENTPGVYVTLNKPFETIKKMFLKEGINTKKIIFIDAVTETSREIKRTEECLFIGSPENLSDISIAMDQAVLAVPVKKKFLFFDSLSTLLIYNKTDVVAKFIHFIAGKMRAWSVKGIIITLNKKEDQELIDELTQFCDVVLEL